MDEGPIYLYFVKLCYTKFTRSIIQLTYAVKVLSIFIIYRI